MFSPSFPKNGICDYLKLIPISPKSSELWSVSMKKGGASLLPYNPSSCDNIIRIFSIGNNPADLFAPKTTISRFTPTGQLKH